MFLIIKALISSGESPSALVSKTAKWGPDFLEQNLSKCDLQKKMLCTLQTGQIVLLVAGVGKSIFLEPRVQITESELERTWANLFILQMTVLISRDMKTLVKGNNTVTRKARTRT